MPGLQQPPVEQFDTKTLLAALIALKKGDFSVRLPVEWEGISGKVADAYNEVLDLNEKMAAELERVKQLMERIRSAEAAASRSARPSTGYSRWM